MKPPFEFDKFKGYHAADFVGWIGDMILMQWTEDERVGPQFHLISPWLANHGGDPIYSFVIDPWLDPDPNCEGDSDEADDWLEDAGEFDNYFLVSPETGSYVAKQCYAEAGEDHQSRGEEGRPLFTQWLFNKCGELIRDWKARNTDGQVDKAGGE